MNRAADPVVVPITTAGYGLRSHVELEPASSGLGHTSFARCDQLRVVSVERCHLARGEWSAAISSDGGPLLGSLV
ncbi:MAG: type II toxin-antitoxin system PemK/MazF family toxin [Mycobacterium sp.]